MGPQTGFSSAVRVPIYFWVSTNLAVLTLLSLVMVISVGIMALWFPDYLQSQMQSDSAS